MYQMHARTHDAVDVRKYTKIQNYINGFTWDDDGDDDKSITQ